MSQSDGTADAGRKAATRCKIAEAYHHGSLREALIDAAHERISRLGVEKLSIAGLCKALGVSSAAPYRHFEDRHAILGEVSARGFRSLAEAMRAARDAHPKGSAEALIAIGQAYVRCAAEDPEMFHVMWGMTREKVHSEVAFEAGLCAYQVLLEAIAAALEQRGLTEVDPVALAMPLWSNVHGLAALRVGERIEAEDPTGLEQAVAFHVRVVFAGVDAMAAHGSLENVLPTVNLKDPPPEAGASA
ncbi:MAG: TetR/AcrR family transcriptional regulator [Pseudomonadota bacterium]